MVRVLLFRNYSVYVFDERGSRHHLPHAHVKHRGQQVASVFLVSLEVFNEVKRLPPEVLKEIKTQQRVLLAKWMELNDDN